MTAFPSTARLPKVCPTCSAPDVFRRLEHDPDIWAHALTSPAWWCDACDRPWLRWCTWHPRWRGGPGPVSREQLEAAL